MKRVILALSSLVLLAGCWGKKEEVAVPQPTETKKTVLVVNVLDKAMYDDAHIKGSINVTMDQLAAEAEKWDKNATIVLYCSNALCVASFDAAKMLSEKGFSDVAAYEGGMAEWFQLSKKNPEYIVEGPAQAEYLSLEVQKPQTEEAAAPSPVKKITAEELLTLIK